jgi:hypothetical protein
MLRCLDAALHEAHRLYVEPAGYERPLLPGVAEVLAGLLVSTDRLLQQVGAPRLLGGDGYPFVGADLLTAEQFEARVPMNRIPRRPYWTAAELHCSFVDEPTHVVQVIYATMGLVVDFSMLGLGVRDPLMKIWDVSNLELRDRGIASPEIMLDSLELQPQIPGPSA